MITPTQYSIMLARTNCHNSQQKPHDACKSEMELHYQIIDECRQRGWIALRSRSDMPTGRPLGEPDFIILADCGKILLVECKSKTGKLSSEQIGFSVMADKLGHKVHLVRSFAEFMDMAITK